MLANKFLSTNKIRLDDNAYEQYEIATKEVSKLSELSSVSWGMITDERYDDDIKISLAEGIVIGLGIAGCVYVGNKIIAKTKHRNKNQ